MGAGSSIVVALVGRQSVAAANPETGPSILWSAAIQNIKSKQGPAGLAPKGCLISAEPVERVVGQIGESQKATCEFAGEMHSCFDGYVSRFVRTGVRCWICVETA